MAPTKSGAQKRVLSGEVRDSPGLPSQHPEFLPGAERRSVSQDDLDMALRNIGGDHLLQTRERVVG